MNKLKIFFTTNFIWKAAALVLAVILWFIGVNINNPVETRSFEVPLLIYNEDRLNAQNRVLLNKQSLENVTVTVRLRARIQDLDALDPSSIRASINLGVVENLSYANMGLLSPTSVNVEAPYEIVTKYPYTVDVLIDQYTSVSKKVTVDTIDEAATGYMAMTPQITPDTVIIRGAQTLLNTIDSVRVEVNVKDAKEEVITQARIRVFDSEREIESGIELSHSEAEVRVPVYMLAEKRVYVPDNYVGEPAVDRVVTGVKIQPEYLSVMGLPKDIAALSRIELEPRNVTGAVDDFIEVVDVRPYLPTNLTIVHGTPNEVTITVKVDALITKELTVSANPIEIISPEGLMAELIQDEIKFMLKGLAVDLEQFNPEEYQAQVELLETIPGEYELPVKLTLPNGVTLIGNPPTVKIIILPGEEDEEDVLED